MPYTLKVTGLEEIQEKLEEAGDRAMGIAARALYDGAGVVADAIRNGAKRIRTAPFKYAKNGEKRLPSPEEKAMIVNEAAIGISKFRKNGLNVNTSIGMNQSGYAVVNWNHMRRNARTNYKIKGGKGGWKNVWSGKAYLERGSDGHYHQKRGKGGLTNTKPVGMIANAINHGTSFMDKQPFIRNAVTRSRKAAEAAIQATISQLTEELLKGA